MPRPATAEHRRRCAGRLIGRIAAGLAAGPANGVALVLLGAALGCVHGGRGASAEWLRRGGEPSVCAGATPPELVLERAPAIAVDDDFQPSGLALHHGRLLTVSDRHNDAVYEIVVSDQVVADHIAADRAAAAEDVATLRPFLRLAAPADGPPPSDLEGVAADADGTLWLASEGRSRVLRVAPDGATAWVTPALDDVGRKVGLLRFPNAGLEGIARLPNGRILLAAERDLRGLIELPAAADGRAAPVRAWAMPGSICTPPPGRDNDFADLTVWGGQVYALERNAHVVMRIERTADAWVERGGWSYARTENDPRFAYQDRAFGVAEGLAIDDAHVYVVLDNNHDRRLGDAGDRRPRLFVFRHPD